jgi:predicted dehydrogenase
MKRRDFITKGSLSAAGVALASTSAWGLPKNFGANGGINIGVIGTGARGNGMIPYMDQIKGLNVAACCDVLPFRLEKGLSKTTNNPKAYSDYRKLLDNQDIDAVFISTPLNTHSSIAMDAIDAGKHVYCEKTLAKGFSGIDSLVKKVETSSKIFQVGHQYHSSRLYAHVLDMIKDGEIGKITSFQCQFNRNSNWRRPLPDPSFERAINWRMYREYSSGLTAELSSHQIDLVQWILGESPSKIMGSGGIDYWKDGRETFDNTHLIYEYPSGVKATFRCLTSNALGNYEIKIHGDKGTIVLDFDKAWIYPEKTKSKKKSKEKYADVDGVSGATRYSEKEEVGYQIEVGHEESSKQALIDFRDNIRDNKMPISNIYTGANVAVAVQLSIDAMYESEIKFADEKLYYSK